MAVTGVGQSGFGWGWQPAAVGQVVAPAYQLGADQYVGARPVVQAGGPADGGNSGGGVLVALSNALSRILEKILSFFRGSRPAQAAAVPGAPAAPQAPGSAGVPPAQAIPAIWQGPPGPLEGFDSGKLNDLNHRTVKYAFARSVAGISLSSVRDHASAEALLRSLVPRFQSAGINVLDVKSDKILVVTEVGAEWVDVIRNAGGGSDTGWWWGSEGKAAPGVPAPPYSPPNPGYPPPLPAAPVPVPGPAPGPAPGGLPALQTVPALPEYAGVPINRASDSAAIISVAEYVKANNPQFFVTDDRGLAYQAMTKVIGILRAAGYDAFRVVNHQSRGVGDPWRYGSDALVLNGIVWDVYAAMGSPESRPQALNVGPYDPSRPRE